MTSCDRDGRGKEKAFTLHFEQRAGIFILRWALQIILPAHLKLFYSPASYKKPRHEDEYLPENRKLQQAQRDICLSKAKLVPTKAREIFLKHILIKPETALLFTKTAWPWGLPK